MKLELFFVELEGLMSRMGARRSSWIPSMTTLDPIEAIRRELREGKEIPLAEVEVRHGGLLSHQGEQVVLYIKDTRKDRATIENDLESAPKFHIAECRTLDRMRREGRFPRYVVTNKTSGEFLIEVSDLYTGEIEELTVPLFVCKNCLTALDWKGYGGKGYAKKQEIRDGFSLEDFFAEFATFFQSRPRYTDETAPRGGYAVDWSRRSERVRQQRGWKCDQCGVVLNDHRSLLHCHHKNGVTSDNSPSNLVVLCLLCHSQQPAHGHLKPRLKHRQIIESLRSRQSESGFQAA